MKVPSLGLGDKSRQSGERGKDWDLMTLQTAEETGKKGAPTERAGDGEMMNSPLAWVRKAGSGGWVEPAHSKGGLKINVTIPNFRNRGHTHTHSQQLFSNGILLSHRLFPVAQH